MSGTGKLTWLSWLPRRRAIHKSITSSAVSLSRDHGPKRLNCPTSDRNRCCGATRHRRIRTSNRAVIYTNRRLHRSFMHSSNVPRILYRARPWTRVRMNWAWQRPAGRMISRRMVPQPESPATTATVIPTAVETSTPPRIATAAWDPAPAKVVIEIPQSALIGHVAPAIIRHPDIAVARVVNPVPVTVGIP